MNIIIEPAQFSYRNYPSGRFQTSPAVKVYELEPVIKTYKGFKVELVERKKASNNEHHRFLVKTINGKKPHTSTKRIESCDVRPFIDAKIKQVFEKINGNKSSVAEDKLFIRYTESNKDLYDVAIGLLINNRYNGKQFNWCFEYLYNKGLSVSELAKFL